jgi:integrase
MATAVENELGRPALYSDCLTFLAQQLALDKDEARVLCSAPHRLSHARSMTVLHPYLHAYLRQRNQATALSSAGWTALFTGIRPLCADPAEDTKKPNHADQNEPDDTNTDEILENDQSGRGSEVLHVLAQLAKTGATITIKDAKIVLENLDTASYWPIEIMLRDWAVDQMARAIKRKQGAPSSVLRYYSALRLPLCAAAETFDLREADTQSLNELFDDALDWPESDQARAFLTQRLQQLYSFCVDRYPEMSKEMDFKALDNAHFGGKIRVRNLYPTEVEYQATVRMMLDGEPFEALPQNRQASLLAGIIAYRGNLRLSETTRLLFMDFQDGIFPEIIIRPSAWGKLKSHQAERRIPVLAFFDDSELAMIRVYVEGRSKTCISSDVLLTNDESGRPMPGAKLFQAFIKALRAVTRNDHFSAHALRHGSVNSTLIRLHVADGMEIPESIVGLNFPRFKKPSCDKLVEILMGRKPDGFLDFQGLFALAVLTGHLSPATTLKSYIHVQDLITHLIWTSANSPTLGSKQVAALIGVSNQRVHQLLTERGLATRDAGNGDYLEITRKQLGAFQSRTQSLMDIPKSIAATLDENELAENIAHRARLLKHLNQPNFDN